MQSMALPMSMINGQMATELPCERSSALFFYIQQIQIASDPILPDNKQAPTFKTMLVQWSQGSAAFFLQRMQVLFCEYTLVFESLALNGN